MTLASATNTSIRSPPGMRSNSMYKWYLSCRQRVEGERPFTHTCTCMAAVDLERATQCSADHKSGICYFLDSAPCLPPPCNKAPDAHAHTMGTTTVTASPSGVLPHRWARPYLERCVLPQAERMGDVACDVLLAVHMVRALERCRLVHALECKHSARGLLCRQKQADRCVCVCVLF